jgi:hypothetical protein
MLKMEFVFYAIVDFLLMDIHVNRKILTVSNLIIMDNAKIAIWDM